MTLASGAPTLVSAETNTEANHVSTVKPRKQIVKTQSAKTQRAMEREMEANYTRATRGSEQSFVHLHVHSEYSLLDGMIRIPDLVRAALAGGFDSIALTDHGGVHGLIPFYRQAAAVGLRPILGTELYVESPEEKSPFHLPVLAENNQGYQNLLKLVTTGHLEGFKRKPLVSKECLAEHARGLIALSGCLQGEIPRLLRQEKPKEALLAAGELKEIFGRENVLIELQNHGLPEEKRILSSLVEVAKGLGLNYLATNDCHYLTEKDADAHDLLLAVQTLATLTDRTRLSLRSREFYLKTFWQMLEFFVEIPEALTITAEVAARCRVELELGVLRLPEFPVPEGFTPESYLRHLTAAGLEQRYPSAFGGNVSGEALPRQIRERLNKELSIINGMGMAGYFLIAWDLVSYAKKEGIPVGPGRGSGVGSLVAYLLGITQINPVEYGLLTYGVILYQEQVMTVAKVLAGFSLGQADLLRRAICKRDPGVLLSGRADFLTGAKKQGVSLEVAEKVFALIQEFGHYGFAKAHSAAYALTAYRTAYLKTRYPVAYHTALLSLNWRDRERFPRYLSETRRKGMKILLPDINRSGALFLPEKGSIRTGLLPVRDLGAKSVKIILNERKRGGPFLSLSDFIFRLAGVGLSKKVVENLIKVGAFTEFNHRTQLLFILKGLWESVRRGRRCTTCSARRGTGGGGKTGRMGTYGRGRPAQGVLFRTRSEEEGVRGGLLPEFSEEVRLNFERELLGNYFTKHPLEIVRERIKAVGLEKFMVSAEDLREEEKEEEGRVLLCGLIDGVRGSRTKKGERMFFASLEDLTGLVDLVFFPYIVKKFTAWPVEREPCLIWGKTDRTAEEVSVIVEGVRPFRELTAEKFS